MFLAVKDTRYLLRRRETWIWTFIMPVVFFYFIGTMTKGFSVSPTSRERIAVVVAPDAGFLADYLLRRLEAGNYQVVRVAQRNALEQYRRQMTIPAGFTQSVLDGKPMKIQFRTAGEGLGGDYDRFRVMRVVYSVLADLIVIATDHPTPAAADFDKLAARPRTLALEVRPAGRRHQAPTGFEQSVPGTMVMFTLLVLFTTGGVSLTIERNEGILRRLASSPMSRGAVVLGKWSARMSLGTVQIAFAMITGALLFGIRWGPHFPMIALVMLAYAALATSLGMLLGNFLRTEGQVVGLGVLLSNVLAAFGGCWWPAEITPEWAQKLALCLPTGWAMDALHKLMNFGAAPSAVLPHLVVLAGSALFTAWLVARRFRFQP